MSPFLAIILTCFASLGLIITSLIRKVSSLETKANDVEVSDLAKTADALTQQVQDLEGQRKAALKAFEDSQNGK